MWQGRLLLLSLIVATEDVLGNPETPFPPQARISGFCNNAGYKCDVTCRYIGQCVASGSGYEWKMLKSCGDEYCKENSPECTSEANACQDEEPAIACLTHGMYPNPYDCTRAYECDPSGVLIPYLCPAGKRYNACTKVCDLGLNDNNSCPQTEPVCTNDDDVHVLSENKRIYYSCISNTSEPYTVTMGQCPEGFYDVDKQSCVLSYETGCHPTNIESENIPCTWTGVREDTKNCRAFFYCNIGLNVTRYLCSPGFKFVPSEEGCIMGDC